MEFSEYLQWDRVAPFFCATLYINTTHVCVWMCIVLIISVTIKATKWCSSRTIYRRCKTRHSDSCHWVFQSAARHRWSCPVVHSWRLLPVLPTGRSWCKVPYLRMRTAPVWLTCRLQPNNCNEWKRQNLTNHKIKPTAMTGTSNLHEIIQERMHTIKFPRQNDMCSFGCVI